MEIKSAKVYTRHVKRKGGEVHLSGVWGSVGNQLLQTLCVCASTDQPGRSEKEMVSGGTELALELDHVFKGD